jgi:hypothetical protein
LKLLRHSALVSSIWMWLCACSAGGVNTGSKAEISHMLQGTSQQGAAGKRNMLPHNSWPVGDWQLNSWKQEWCRYISFTPAGYHCKKLQFKEYVCESKSKGNF